MKDRAFLSLLREPPLTEAGHHAPQDYQSLLMHREAVRMVLEDPSLVDKIVGILSRWDSLPSGASKALRNRWVQIVREQDWALAIEESERGTQLRQASPMACVLPNSVRLQIIAKVRALKDALAPNAGNPA